MSSKLMIGPTGTGRTGQVHTESIAALPETTLRWTCDPVGDGARTTAQKHEGSRATSDSTSPCLGDDRATTHLADADALRSAVKGGSVDVGTNA